MHGDSLYASSLESLPFEIADLPISFRSLALLLSAFQRSPWLTPKRIELLTGTFLLGLSGTRIAGGRSVASLLWWRLPPRCHRREQWNLENMDKMDAPQVVSLEGFVVRGIWRFSWAGRWSFTKRNGVIKMSFLPDSWAHRPNDS